MKGIDMRQLLLTVMIVGGVVAFVLPGGQVAAQDHGGAGHGAVSLSEQLMRADTNEDGNVTSVELVSLLGSAREAHGGGDADGTAHHGNAQGHGNPHGDLGVGHGAANLATLLGGRDGTAIGDMSKADLEARMTMLVTHADTNNDAALNTSEVDALVAMLRTGGGH